MKRVLWKFAIGPGDTRIRLDPRAVIRSAGFQGMSCYVWVELDPEAQPTADFTFRMVMTGQEFRLDDGPRWQFIGTAHLPNALPAFVAHIYCSGPIVAGTRIEHDGPTMD